MPKASRPSAKLLEDSHLPFCGERAAGSRSNISALHLAGTGEGDLVYGGGMIS